MTQDYPLTARGSENPCIQHGVTTNAGNHLVWLENLLLILKWYCILDTGWKGDYAVCFLKMKDTECSKSLECLSEHSGPVS